MSDQPHPVSSSSPTPTTLYEKLLQSSHPIAILFFLGLRILPVLIYLFGTLFTNNFILYFITIILLLAADFWNIKNISGRLLVGLRWWNESNELGETIWVFENADDSLYINPIDSNVFWSLLYAVPIIWSVFGILALINFHFVNLLLILIAMTLAIINSVAYTKCDKFGKANNLANNLFSNFFSNLNPLNRFF